MEGVQLPDAALHGVIANCKSELAELYAVVQQEQRRKLQRWQDEEPMLECQIEALTGTRDIINREQKQLTTELGNLKAHLEKQAAEAAHQGLANAALASNDEARLQEQLQDLSAKIAELDEELTGLVPKLSATGAAACRPDELSYYETKLVVIQDTRRLLQSEATALSAELKRRQTAARLAADRDTAAQLGLSDLGRLGERLAGVEAALDRAKLERYFPAQRGFRFSGGGGGVYCGVKDLHLSEVSGAFSIALESVPAAGAGAAAGAGGSNAQREVRLKVTLSGIATGTSSQEYKQQQQQQKQQQATKAAAQAKSLKRQQTYHHQQQQQHSASLQHSSTTQQRPSGLDSPSRQQQQQQQGSPMQQRGFGGGSGAGSGGNRRNAAIAKFLGQLNEKKDALSQAIKTSPLSKGLDDSSPRGTSQPRPLYFGTGSSGGGLTKHLAGTFGDKAAGFSQRRDQQNPADNSSSNQGLMGALGGMGVAGSSGELQGSSACCSNDAAAAASSTTDGGSSGSMLVPSDHPAAAAAAGQPYSAGVSSLSTAVSTGSSNGSAAAAAVGAPASTGSSNGSAAAAAAVGAAQPHSPMVQVTPIGLQGPTNNSSSTGSWQQQELHSDGQLKSKFGGMKGKLGGLLADSKQKLADSKQKLADSKLLQESKQKLADSKQKLADSKLFTESRAAAKHLLEDSKHFIEDSKEGIKKSLSNIQDKQQQQQPPLGGTPRTSFDRQQQQQQGGTPRSSLDRQQQQRQHSSTPRSSLDGLSKAAAGQQQQQRQGGTPTSSLDIQQQQLQQETAAAGPPPEAVQAAVAQQQPQQDQQQQPAHVLGAGHLTEEQQHQQQTSHVSTSETDAAAAAAAVPESSAALTAPAAARSPNGTVSSAAATAAGSSDSFPAVAAATAAAASTGELDRQLLDEAWVGDAQGGVGGGASSSSSASGWVPGVGAAAGVARLKGSGSRKGVVVMLLAEGLEILGEKGTKVPNIRATRLGLEVECVLSACLTYSSTLGWQSAGLSFEVVSLECVVEGSNIPVPKTLIKSVLNLVMPSVFTKLLLTSLPHELGQFILDSAAAVNLSSSSSSRAFKADAPPSSAAAAAIAAAGGAGVWLAGELCLTGPPLACLSACLTRSAEEVPSGRASLTSFVQELRAAQKARALLNLPDPSHARALALLFTPGSPFCLLDTSAAAAGSGGSNAAAASGAGSSVLGVPASLTLRELCRFYLDYADSSAWGEICVMWQIALDAVCLHLAREEGLLPPEDTVAAGADKVLDIISSNGSVAAAQGAAAALQQQHQQQQFSFSFEQLLTGRVAGLVRKPVRLSFGLNKLLLGLDAAAGLAAARDYCERAAREFAESAKGEDALLLLQRPLSQQLELLHLWHAALSTYLETFLQQFREAGGRVMLAADKETFSIAVEDLSYEGPMRLQIPLPLLVDLATGACNIDLSLPNPEFAVSSITSKLRFISSAIAKAAFGKCEEEFAASRHAAAVAEAVKCGADLPLTMLEELEALMTIWNAGAAQRERHTSSVATTAAAATVGTSSDIKLNRAGIPNQRSSSTAAAATASITRNSLANASRTSSINAGLSSAPESRAAADAAAAAAVGGATAADGVPMRGDSNVPGWDGVAAGGGTGRSGRGMIGRVCMTKASAGLVLDEKRLKELMAGGGLQVAGLLGCFGQLFTATIAPGWPSQHQDGTLLAASMDLTGTSSSGGNSSSSTEGGAVPQAIVTLRNNEVTRVKANLEAASFESAVSPRIAVRLLHMLVLAVAHKFGSGSSKRLEIIHKVFSHVAEYLGRDCLDLLLCVDVAAAAVTPAAAAAGSQAVSSGALQQQPPALQLLLAGAAPGPSASAAAVPVGGGSSSSAAAGGGACCYIINDVNLLTVLETVRLLMDYSS